METNIDYKEKYLKYKQKYLDLKNLQSGGGTPTPTPAHTEINKMLNDHTAEDYGKFNLTTQSVDDAQWPEKVKKMAEYKYCWVKDIPKDGKKKKLVIITNNPIPPGPLSSASKGGWNDVFKLSEEKGVEITKLTKVYGSPDWHMTGDVESEHGKHPIHAFHLTKKK